MRMTWFSAINLRDWKRQARRSLHLSLAARGRAQRSLNLSLIHSVNCNPRERTSDHQRPDRVPRQRVWIKAETTMRHIFDYATRNIMIIITTLIIHHPIILPFQTQNFPISQILPSIDICTRSDWFHGLLYGFFFSVSVFSSFQLSFFPSVLVFLSYVSYISHSRLFLDFFLFCPFLVPFKTFLVFF